MNLWMIVKKETFITGWYKFFLLQFYCLNLVRNCSWSNEWFQFFWTSIHKQELEFALIIVWNGIQKDGVQVGSAEYEFMQEKGKAFFGLVYDLALSLAIVQALAFVSSIILGFIVYRDKRISDIDASKQKSGQV